MQPCHAAERQRCKRSDLGVAGARHPDCVVASEWPGRTLDEARRYGSLVPIVVWPDGRVEQGFGDTLGCFL
jgi:hypothetical protein